MEELNKLLKTLGYTEYDINEIINTYPISSMRTDTLIQNVKRNYTFLVELGYSQEEIIKMTKSFPSIYGLSIDNMKQKIEDIKQLGYSQEEVIKITKSLPSIYGYSIENMKQKIEDIQQLGYSQEEVIKMTKSLPAIYSYSIENMKQKIEFYDYIGLHSLAVMSPKQLMQSTALSYARYMFLKEIGIRIDETNYKKLFYDQKQFQKQYGITKKELLEKYDYERDFKGKSPLELVIEAQETIGEDISYIDDTEQVIAKQEKQIEGQENSQIEE